MENKLSIEEKFSMKLLHGLKKNIVLTEIQEAKISYGLSMLMITLGKVSLIYLIAFSLGTVSETLLSHLPFCIVRSYSRGFHAKSSLNCGMSGIICFSILPWLIKTNNWGISFLPSILIGFICTVILFFRAPANTEKNQVTNERQRKNLRKKAIIANSILFILILVECQSSERLIGMSGLLITSFLALPLEKILWKKTQEER
ncbi:accessory gene regulator B family protein [Enterococcus sp. LJL98]